MKNTRTHWNHVYQTKQHSQLSWHQDHATLSFDWIKKSVKKDAAIIDIGCGVSVLVEDLLAAKFSDISLLELSAQALNTVKIRLKNSAKNVQFYNEDVLNFQTHKRFDL